MEVLAVIFVAARVKLARHFPQHGRKGGRRWRSIQGWPLGVPRRPFVGRLMSRAQRASAI